jgi:PKD repeat protein
MRQRGRIYLDVVLLTVLLVASSLAGCLSEDDNGNGNGNGGGEVLANAGTDVFGLAGEVITFNASLSSGEIVKYWWDVDQVNASDSLTEDLVGKEVTYTYDEPGVYTVTLTVEGKKDKTSNDTLTAYIDLVETISSTLEIAEINETYEYTVDVEVQKISLTLTYPTLSDDIIPRILLLDLDVYTDQTQPIATTSTQPPDTGETQTEELEVPTASAITNGGFTIVVRWGEPPLANADFELKVEIYYRAV